MASTHFKRKMQRKIPTKGQKIEDKDSIEDRFTRNHVTYKLDMVPKHVKGNQNITFYGKMEDKDSRQSRTIVTFII